MSSVDFRWQTLQSRTLRRPVRVDTGLRVLHVAETMRGGVGTILRSLAVHQSQVYGDCNVAVVVPDAHAEQLDGAALKNVYRFRRSGRNVGSLVSLALTLRRAVARHRPDIVHLHSTFGGVVGRILHALQRQSGVKIVYTPHAFPFMMQSSQLKQSTYAKVEAQFAKLADAIVCVSEYERQAAISAGLPADRLKLIYNGVSWPARASGVARQREGGPLRLLFVGRLDRQKGLDVLLAALHQLPPHSFHLTVVGASVNDADGQCALPNVEYKGWVPHDQLGSFYREADVLVMPSRWEGFALVPLEALSHGLPVVASRCCSMPEVITHNETGLLFDVDDSAELAQCLEMTSRDQFQKLGREGQRFVKAMFTQDGMHAKTLDLYHELVAKRVVLLNVPKAAPQMGITHRDQLSMP